MILCIGTTPAAQRVMVFRKLTLDAVNRAAATRDGSAGKSVNVAKVLKALGAQPLAAGFLGGDRGKTLLADLEARGILTEFISVGAPTRQCITVIDETTGMHTELVEESAAVAASAYDELAAILRRHLKDCRAVILSGSLTAGGPVDFYARCIRLAEEAGALSVVDAQGPPLIKALEAGPGLVKPNRAELAATVGRNLATERDVVSAMRDLAQRGARRVVVTAGKDPALAFDGRLVWRITPPLIRAVNPIGSGDAFTAALAWRLAAGDDLGEACRWAAAAGAANALSLLPGELERADVERLAREAGIEHMTL
jgi:tagatose 6-phosphate kinase